MNSVNCPAPVFLRGAPRSVLSIHCAAARPARGKTIEMPPAAFRKVLRVLTMVLAIADRVNFLERELAMVGHTLQDELALDPERPHARFERDFLVIGFDRRASREQKESDRTLRRLQRFNAVRIHGLFAFSLKPRRADERCRSPRRTDFLPVGRLLPGAASARGGQTRDADDIVLVRPLRDRLRRVLLPAPARDN